MIKTKKRYGYTIWDIIFDDLLSTLPNKSNWLNICWKLQHATLDNATRELNTDKKYYHKSKKWSIARHQIYLIMKYVLICTGHGISVILKRELIENDWRGRHKARKIRLKILEIKCIQTTDWCTWPNTLLSLLLPHITINWCTRIARVEEQLFKIFNLFEFILSK